MQTHQIYENQQSNMKKSTTNMIHLKVMEVTLRTRNLSIAVN